MTVTRTSEDLLNSRCLKAGIIEKLPLGYFSHTEDFNFFLENFNIRNYRIITAIYWPAESELIGSIYYKKRFSSRTCK